MKSLLWGITLILAASTASAAEFTEPHWGVRFTYPDGWRTESPEAFSLILRPPAADAPDAVAVSMQNVRRPDSVTPDAGPGALAERYATEMLAQAKQVKVLREAPFRWDTPDAVIMGRQVVADFTQDGLPLRQWAVFLPSPYAPVIHVWLFTAPQALFDDWLVHARETLDSLVPAQPEKERMR